MYTMVILFSEIPTLIEQLMEVKECRIQTQLVDTIVSLVHYYTGKKLFLTLTLYYQNILMAINIGHKSSN